MGQIGERFDEVLAAARQGADWAWTEIIRSLIGPVRGFLASPGADDPDGTTNEVFLHVARGLHGFAGGVRPGP
jgi:RNA polymerase sigma-70 factor (ECF subfamily)